MTKIEVAKKEIEDSYDKIKVVREKFEIRYDKNQGNQEKLNKSMTKTKFV